MNRALASLLPACVLALLPACGPSAPDGPPDSGFIDTDPCVTEGQGRCNGNRHQICTDGIWQSQQDCNSPLVCAPTLGCAECDPTFATACDGDNVVTCNQDGSKGPVQQMCGFEQCSNGHCGSDDCETEGVKLIYVVDESYNLLSFDPGMGNVFTLIGRLSCPASASWPEWGGIGPATPFSMSVDRNAVAWVLYTSGEIFHVSTTDASCSPTSWVKGSGGYQLFGMGFVADSPGSNSEKLYIAGGPASALETGDLGYIDPGTYGVSTVGPLPSAEYSPELTGTGDAELYAYYPGSFSTFVARVDRATGQNAQTWNLPALSGSVMAWAFAHWGGQFYIFVTTVDDFTLEEKREVYLLNPMTGSATLLLPDIPYVIVGAGVSTCAPVIIGHPAP
jgi:hypothetical protein